MVQQTESHMLRCCECATIFSDEGELIYKEKGVVIVNHASNIIWLPTMELTTGIKIQPAECAECQLQVGFRFEQNLLHPAHHQKIVLQTVTLMQCPGCPLD
ncbi:hypothetical protein ACLKA7_003040 [Drosophila subpalustris]